MQDVLGEIVEGWSVHGVSGLGMAFLVEWQFNADVVPPGTLISSLNTTFAQQNAEDFFTQYVTQLNS